MEYRRLGRSGLTVSEICLGTMTFGSRVGEKEAFPIMDCALDHGVDFFDTAEVYPVPPSEEYVHRTEEIVGKWLASRDRDRVILASKVVGPADAWFAPPIRAGKTALDRRSIRRALEGSLQRLRTDHIDLYQIHWPDPDFGYGEILETLDEFQKEGKIRLSGVSNENAWGAMKALHVAEKRGLARFETIQNNFSLNNRRFEDELAEVCRREGLRLLPYSPLAGGVLSGKYNDGHRPEGARFSNYLQKGGERQKKMATRFVNEKSLARTAELRELAGDLGIDPVTLAVAWSKQHDFVASTIVGANSVEQLRPSLGAAGQRLAPDTLERIDQICRKHPYPMG